MQKLWSLLFASFLIICLSSHGDGKALPKKRVCVIGAGRAGLAAVKLVADRTDDFEPIGFERNSDVGGLWIYRDSVDLDEPGLPAQSGIYQHLKTNIPKDFMEYPDYPEFEGEEFEIVPHEMVLEYLRNYTHEFELRKYIQFDTLVTKVIPKKGDGDWKTTTWRLESRNLNTNKEKVTVCDAVMVCNGHYSKPNIPEIPGMETFPGRVLHSRSYRKPTDFADKTVVVLGAGNSGEDIARDLSHHAKNVYLSHRHHEIYIPYEYSNLQQVRGVVAANGSELTLQDNTTIVADAFMFCTGYLFDFPFLDQTSGIIVEKEQARPLFLQSINVEHPSMIFVGLPIHGLYGSLYYEQSTVFLDLLQDKQKLPNYEDMLENSKIFSKFYLHYELSNGKVYY